MKKQLHQGAWICLFWGGFINLLLAQNATQAQLSEPFQTLEINSKVVVELVKCKPKQERIVWGANYTEVTPSFFQLNKGKLSIQPPSQAQPITVYYSQLEALIVNATQAQVFSAKPIKNRFINITINGGGSITIPYKSSDANIIINGDAEAHFSLQAKQQSITINGSATVVLKGKAQNQCITLNGSGSVQAGELKAKSGSITLNGSGMVEVKTTQELVATLNGSGKIYQKGKGKTIEKLNGSGAILGSREP